MLLPNLLNQKMSHYNQISYPSGFSVQNILNPTSTASSYYGLNSYFPNETPNEDQSVSLSTYGYQNQGIYKELFIFKIKLIVIISFLIKKVVHVTHLLYHRLLIKVYSSNKTMKKVMMMMIPKRFLIQVKIPPIKILMVIYHALKNEREEFFLLNNKLLN